MCGIVAVLRRASSGSAPDPQTVFDALGAAAVAAALDAAALNDLAAELALVDGELRKISAVRLLVDDASLIDRLEAGAGAIRERLNEVDAAAEAIGGETVEDLNAALVRARDAVWAIERDRVHTARAIADLAGPNPTPSSIEGYWSVQVALAGIDRLEVRGRDSAGLRILVTGHDLDLSSPSIQPMLGDARVLDDKIAFGYVTAAEIGELGDNTGVLRERIRDDRLLRLALSGPSARAQVLGHTRWASVGIISEANAHPLDEVELDHLGPYVAAALNGDVDNYGDLKAAESLQVAAHITTDAKVIPAMVSRRLDAGADPLDAFRSTVAQFVGSVAIAMQVEPCPDDLMLALRGSGQALYVGLAPDAFVVASEPYGLVEEATSYLRMDGDVAANPDNPTASQGQIVWLDGTKAGAIAGISRVAYDGTQIPVEADEFVIPEITTRDIDRGEFPHFLLKEISEAPSSFRKTLRGKIETHGDKLRVNLGHQTLPPDIRERLESRKIRRVYVIGQGTAAVAGQAVEAAMAPLLEPAGVHVEATPATELSGFALTADMSDALVIAISQSGTTTDTNRTVDLVRARGAAVVAIVNRRGSDLTDKSDGVLYTSDGRDVEMSVASTKAFYAQVAAGFLLALAIAELVDSSHEEASDPTEILRALRRLPEAMSEVIAKRDEIGAIARRHAPSHRYWAVVGSGADRIAAAEIRIKLSELCYKSISCDVTEDKKHIDLSAEPLILVCAAGLRGSNADDVAKEVAIYRAHRSTPIVISSTEGGRYDAATELITVPAVHQRVDFVLSAVVGHLFGYEAALAIDAQARPLRAARMAIEETISGDTNDLLGSLGRRLRAPAGEFLDGLRTGAYNGHLEASTGVRLVSVMRYGTGESALDGYQLELGKVGTPSVVVDDLNGALTTAIDELTRPVDTIKHQAKTVTVGISRFDESLLAVPLVADMLSTGAPRDRISYRSLRTLAELDPAVDAVVGFTRYRIEGDIEGEAFLQVVDSGGIAREITSRVHSDPRLRGTKHRAAFEREVTVARGRSDGRTVIIVPEVKDQEPTGITLLHTSFEDRLPAGVMRGVLRGYRHRYDALKDAVTETEPNFRDDVLGDIDVVALLTEPVYVLAEHWTR